MPPFAPFAAPILLSALCLGFYDIAKKSSVNGNSVMPVLFFSSLTGMAGFIAALFFSGNLAASVICTAPEFGWYSLKALLVGSSWICTYYALRELPITIAAPIRASSPLWTLLGGMALYGEIPNRTQTLGMALIFAGYAIFTIVGKKEGFRPTGKGMILVTLGTLLGAASALYDKYLLNFLGCPRFAVQFYFSVGITVFLGVVCLIRQAFPHGRKFIFRWQIPATGLLVILADYFYFKALALPDAEISILSMLRRCNVIVPFLFGCFFWHEADKTRKSAALLLILGGAALLALAGH